MRVIKGVLEEELENSRQLKKEYEKALDALPRGVLVKKEIGGHIYYYLMSREGSKVRFEYKGKPPKDEIKKYDEAKRLRAKYRKLLAEVKKQISFLERALRGKEIRSLS